MSDAVRREIEAFTRSLLESRLAQLTPAQRALFDRVYPNGPKSDALISAIDLCDRTITKNVPLTMDEAGPSITAATISALAAIDAALGMPEDACNSTARALTAIRLLHSAHRDDVAEIARLERERDNEERTCLVVMDERDRATDVIRDVHQILGGDGEWCGRLPPQDPPNSGDLHLDLPVLAEDVMRQLAAARAVLAQLEKEGLT